jgi:hypothetical protein
MAGFWKQAAPHIFVASRGDHELLIVWRAGRGRWYAREHFSGKLVGPYRSVKGAKDAARDVQRHGDTTRRVEGGAL